jgi:hypothetical protein
MTRGSQGWELVLVRSAQQQTGLGRTRTVGSYAVYQDGVTVDGLSGAVAEPKGPGSNDIGVNRRILPGRYPLLAIEAPNYSTFRYTDSPDPFAAPRPGIGVARTGKRSEIIIHPGTGFLTSVGGIILCGPLPGADARIDFADSRTRTIAIIQALRDTLGSRFPVKEAIIPYASLVIEESFE